MKKNFGLRLIETAALLALCITVCGMAWAQGRQENLNGNILRLHVLAVSDEEHEQQLKLKVRDNVLQYLEPLLETAKDARSAESIISENLYAIADAAYEAAEGRQVCVSLGEERYSSREHEGVTLPAGRYKSLQVILGEGQGQNWWCVVYPQLCLNSTDTSTLGEQELKIVTDSDNRVLRFKLLELWGNLTAKD